jgi:hypothetical protein
MSCEKHTIYIGLLHEEIEELEDRIDELEEDAFHLTGPELFQAYDLPLMARQRRYYLYSESVMRYRRRSCVVICSCSTTERARSPIVSF